MEDKAFDDSNKAQAEVENNLDLPSFESIARADKGNHWLDWLERWCKGFTCRSVTLNKLFAPISKEPSFVELESRYDRLLAKTKGEIVGEISEESQPCLCLVCGKCLQGGKKDANNVGACHVHANTEGHCGANAAVGVGVFICLRSTRVVIMRKKWAAYYPSIYVDEYGETDPYMRRGAPLVLNRRRLAKLQQLWTSGRLANEVTSIRMKSSRIILDNWF